MAIIKRETDYALRVLSRLADEQEFRSAAALAEEAGVPLLFLRKIAQSLHNAGLLESRQGPFGGYRLDADPREVTVRQVIEIVQGPLLMNSCFSEDRECSRQDFCPVRDKLGEVQKMLDATFEGVTLADVVASRKSERQLENQGDSR